MTINHIGSNDFAFFMNAAIDQNVEKIHQEENNQSLRTRSLGKKKKKKKKLKEKI